MKGQVFKSVFVGGFVAAIALLLSKGLINIDVTDAFCIFVAVSLGDMLVDMWKKNKNE